MTDNNSSCGNNPDGSPRDRIIDNMAAGAEAAADAATNPLEYMNSPQARAFYKMRRRHKSGPFNALFFDKEALSEADIAKRVARASAFFGLPVPEMIKASDCLADITYSTVTELGSEIRYNMSRLEAIGINNGDAFETLMTHELAHQFVEGHRFSFSQQHDWCVELLCDFIAGLRCEADNLASGKYKYAVSILKCSPTHPFGRLRMSAVEAGFEFAAWLRPKGAVATARLALGGFNRFLALHSAEINRLYSRAAAEGACRPTTTPDPRHLPPTNLIRQYVERFESRNKL